MDRVDITVIGAGVIGLAIAGRVSNDKRSVVVLERHSRFGQEASSRNSEVIHAGIYYPPGSLKARLCLAGVPRLYAYCRQMDIPHARLGKIIVATKNHEIKQLEKLYQNATQNGVPNLELLDQKQVKSLEPEIQCLAGLYSPNTGIIDTHAFMQNLSHQAEEKGALIAYDSEVIHLEKTASGFIVTIKKESFRFESRIVINSAGLSADRVTALAGIDIDRAGYRLHYCKGDYFRTRQVLKAARLIYPVPSPNVRDLGIHLTKDLAGGIRFGPDADYVKEIDYQIDDAKKSAFCDSVRQYLPGIQPDDFYADTSGIRAKLQGPDDDFRDFVIRHEANRSLAGLINLIGIESPGLTSSLAIADYVEEIVKGLGR